MMVFVGGCVAADEPSSAPAPLLREVAAPSATMNAPEATGPDLCALAEQLAADNICSLVCAPDAMKDFLLAAGKPAGRCYELTCALSASTSVNVGVCLPP